MDYTVVIERADDGSLSVYVPDLAGCVSCGDTAGQALDSIQEAFRDTSQRCASMESRFPRRDRLPAWCMRHNAGQSVESGCAGDA